MHYIVRAFSRFTYAWRQGFSTSVHSIEIDTLGKKNSTLISEVGSGILISGVECMQTSLE